MQKEDLKNRTKEFAIRVIKLVNALHKNSIGRTIGNQLLRAGTSVGSNYRAACRVKSKADFIYKINKVEEADESAFWLDMIKDVGLLSKRKVQDLLNEVYELIAIFVTTGKTAKSKK
jgi:four helix bundle protein